MLNSSESENTGKILFVDDEESITKTLYRQFMPLGYDVLLSNNPEEALELLESQVVDVVVSDMRMPQMDGATFLEKVHEKWPDIQRILLTGYSDIGSAIDAVNKGRIQFYLTKPWKENQVETAISSSLETKKLRDQNQHLQEALLEKNKQLEDLNTHLEKKVQERTEALKKSTDATIEICASLVENFQPLFRGHGKKVATLAQPIAKMLSLTEMETQDVLFGARLYNIGKIGLDKLYVETPVFSLSVQQKKILEHYPLHGATLLSSMEGLKSLSTIVQTHREYFNGKGYPNKLKGDDIPLGARILALCIDFEQLQLGLILEDKLTIAQTIDYLKSNPDGLYDPKVIEAFEDVVSSMSFKETSLEEKVVALSALEPGMKLSRDLVSPNGMMLLPKGYVLDGKNIQNLKKIGGLTLYIE